MIVNQTLHGCRYQPALYDLVDRDRFDAPLTLWPNDDKNTVLHHCRVALGRYSVNRYITLTLYETIDNDR